MQRFFRLDRSLIAFCCLLMGGCGSQAGEHASKAQPAAADTAAASAPTRSRKTSPRESDAAPDEADNYCSMYGGGGGDVMSQPAAYLFIGEHPMCADQEKKQDFCKFLATREGYVITKENDDLAGQAGDIAKTLPEESRDFYMRQHPAHALEQAMLACGFKPDQLHSRLVSDAVAAIPGGKAPGVYEDINFLLKESPDTAKGIWTRECGGHMKTTTRGEDIDFDFNGNAAYSIYCQRTTTADNAKAPPKFSGS